MGQQCLPVKRTRANVTVNDKNIPTDKQVLSELENAGIKVIVGSHPLALLDEAELIVKILGSPTRIL